MMSHKKTSYSVSFTSYEEDSDGYFKTFSYNRTLKIERPDDTLTEPTLLEVLELINPHYSIDLLKEPDAFKLEWSSLPNRHANLPKQRQAKNLTLFQRYGGAWHVEGVVYLRPLGRSSSHQEWLRINTR